MPDTDQTQVGLTGLGKFIVTVFVLAFIGAGAWVFYSRSTTPPPRPVPPPVVHPGGNDGTIPASHPTGGGIEAPDLTDITTAKEYTYVPEATLPAVKGVSNYKWDEKTRTVQFPINVWIGWLPIIAANHGSAANDESVFFRKYGFRVNLKLIDDPVAARDAFASGDSHILWGTLDMIVLFAPDLMKDSRTSPRVFQQIDWSNGGDGIVVRNKIRSVRDLRGGTIAYAQNSPSQYYINSLLVNAGLQPGDVRHKYTDTAFSAAAAFVSDKSIDACVSWAPDIYTIPEKVPGTKILSTTADANKLIADVWAARADFAKDHPDVIKGLVSGIFEGMDLVRENPDQACQWLAAFYNMSLDEVKSMLLDAHPTNFAENKEFFLNRNNPANFERTWNSISSVYREIGRLSAPVPFDQVMDFSALQGLAKDGAFPHHRDEYVTNFVPRTYRTVTTQAEAPIITQTIRINFFPNSSNIYEQARDSDGMVIEGRLYDPGVERTLERVARLAGQFEAATIAITGHTDDSMRDRVAENLVRDLALRRAQAVKKALVEKYKFDPNKFVVEGIGWGTPADPQDPHNHALNRRVEVAVYPPERE